MWQAAGGSLVTERWCDWHFPSPESRTGQLCLAHMAEAFVPDCPYRTLEEKAASTDYSCDYQPVREMPQ